MVLVAEAQQLKAKLMLKGKFRRRDKMLDGPRKMKMPGNPTELFVVAQGFYKGLGLRPPQARVTSSLVSGWGCPPPRCALGESVSFLITLDYTEILHKLLGLPWQISQKSIRSQRFGAWAI